MCSHMIAMRRLSALWEKKSQYISAKSERDSGGLRIIHLADSFYYPRKRGFIVISKKI